MPGLDKTGPLGQGAQTGRRMGKCQENIINDVTECRIGKRRRFGNGNGYGRKNQENFGRRHERKGGRGLGRLN